MLRQGSDGEKASALRSRDKQKWLCEPFQATVNGAIHIEFGIHQQTSDLV